MAAPYLISDCNLYKKDTFDTDENNDRRAIDDNDNSDRDYTGE